MVFSVPVVAASLSETLKFSNNFSSNEKALLSMTQGQQDQSMQSRRAKPGSIALFRMVGYSLLLLALLDLIAIIFPPRLMNPAWEFETMGAIVERVPVPLLGLVLISFGEGNFRGTFERIILKFLRWLCLFVGVLFLLLIPLGVNNTMRLNTQNTAQKSAQYRQQVAQIEQIEKQLKQATAQDLDSFLRSQGRSLDGQNPRTVKKQLSSEITKTKQTIQTKYQEQQANQRLALFKNSVKWNLGALISGVLFIYLWYITRWVW